MATRQRRGRDARPPKAAAASAAPETVANKSQSEKFDEQQQQHDETLTASTAVMSSIFRNQPVWVVLAVASGACAAINGVFAKLTTTSLTGNLASSLSSLMGLSPDNNAVNVTLRGSFFGLNLLFNGIMWTLFTKALTAGDSTTRVSIVNVSANFFITAMLGWAIFSEKLPLGWWMGAGLLAAGNVVIGMREEGDGKKVGGAREAESEQSGGLIAGSEQEDLIELDGPSGGPTRNGTDDENRLKKGEAIDAPI